MGEASVRKRGLRRALLAAVLVAAAAAAAGLCWLRSYQAQRAYDEFRFGREWRAEDQRHCHEEKKGTVPFCAQHPSGLPLDDARGGEPVEPQAKGDCPLFLLARKYETDAAFLGTIAREIVAGRPGLFERRTGEDALSGRHD